MHQALRFGRPGIENGSGVPKDLQNVGVMIGFVVPKRDTRSIEPKGFHPYVLFDANW